MRGKWREVHLGDVAEIVMGQSPPGSTYNESGDGLPFFQGVKDFGYRNPTPRVFCSRPSRVAQPGDILFSVRAPIGRVNIADRECTIGRGLSIIQPRDKAGSRYIEFALRYLEPTWQAIEGGGSVFGNATRQDVELLSLTWPDEVSDRRIIAEVLGSLDDKIELNRRMNATLESMARAVFKAWFMENEEAKGWKIGQIKDLGDVVCGKTPPTNDKENYDGDIPFITIPDMHNKVFITQTRKTLSEKGAQTQSKKTLPVFAICVSCIATPGLVSLTTKPSQTNQQINNLVPNDKKSVFYCYYALRALADEIRARGSGGSVVVNLNKGQFEILPVVIPPATKLHEFQEQVEPLFLRLLANENESRTLAALRDALLPRLMSGEVRVGEG